MIKHSSKKGFVILILAVIIAAVVGIVWLLINAFTGGFNNSGSVDKQVATVVVNYLDKKYGKHGFNVTETKDNTSSDTYGFTSTKIGYVAKVETSRDSNGDYSFFTVYTEGTDPSTTSPIKDDFLEKYYIDNSAGINNFAYTGYDIDPSFVIDNTKAPNDMGHIPSPSEMASYGIMSEISLYQTSAKSLGSTDSLKATALKNIALAVIDYYKITNDITISYTTNNESGSGMHKIIVTDRSVTVRIGYSSENQYTFNR